MNVQQQTNVSNVPVNNGNTFVVSNGNLSNTNLSNVSVQSNNVNYVFNNKVNVQEVNVSRNVNRNVNVNLANDNVEFEQVIDNGSRGGDVQVVDLNRNRGNEVAIQSNENPVYNQVIDNGTMDNNVDFVFNEVIDNGTGPNDINYVFNEDNVTPNVEQQMVIDNVDNGININPQINVPQVNVPQVELNVDMSLDLSRNQSNQVKVKEEKVKEVKVKEEKSIATDVAISMPKVSLNLNLSLGSKSTAKKTVYKSKKVKVKRNFGYKQHVSILEKIAKKTEGIKKVIAKNKKKKKTICSVVCYQF